MEMKNPPPMMTEKMPTTKPPTRSSAVSRVSSQGASALIHERSITVLHPDARDDMHLLPLQRREPHRPPPPRIEGGLEALPSPTSITRASRNAVDVDTHFRVSTRSNTAARGCDGGLREVMATGLKRVTVGAERAVHVDHCARLPDSNDGIPNVPRRFMGCFDSDFRGGGQNGARPVQILCDNGRPDIRRPCHDRHWAGPQAAAADRWQAMTVGLARFQFRSPRSHTATSRHARLRWRPSPRAGGGNETVRGK